MKPINTVVIFLILFLSCNDSKKNDHEKNIQEKNEISGQKEQPSFFPVTDFLRGQIAEIKTRGINPIKITSTKNRQDSVWLKTEDMNDEFAPFLSPVIDSTNLAGMFAEKTFLDQTIDAFTFTYDPIKALPDSFLLQRWDVYVDPKSSRVRRVYMIKKSTEHKILQLTWLTGKSCRIISIANDSKGNDYVEKEVNIKWDF